jgi:hypothetical protein
MKETLVIEYNNLIKKPIKLYIKLILLIICGQNHLYNILLIIKLK